MELIDYAKNIKTFKQSEVISSIQNQLAFINGIQDTLDLVKSNNIDLSRSLDNWAVTNQITKEIHRVLSPSMSYWELIKHNFGVIQTVLNFILNEISTDKTKLYDGNSITIKQANYFNIIEMASFWVKYTNLVIDILLSMENKEQKDATPAVVSKTDLAFVNKTRAYYSDLCIQFAEAPNTIIGHLKKMPDVPASENNIDVLMSSKGIDSVRAMRGIAIHLLTPMFWIKELKMEWDIKSIKSYHEDNQYNAMKIEQLNNKRNGKIDTTLDFQISKYQDKIQKNRYEIEKIEARYAKG